MKFIDDILGNVQKAKDEDGGSGAIPKTRSTIACAVIGGIAGLMIGVSRKWNMLYSAGGGAILGALVGNLFVPRVKKTEDTEDPEES